MLKEAMQFILDMARPATIKAEDGKLYTPLNLTRLDGEKDVESLRLTNLSGLVDYVKSHFDHEKQLLIHIESPTSVAVYDALDDKNDRRAYVRAKAMLPTIKLEQFLTREKFNIQLQACYVDNPGKAALLEAISTIVEDESIKQEDNGVTQTMTAKTGVTTREEKAIPNPVELKPYRTFIEVPQPESAFVFRIEKSNQGPACGLFEADGGAWEHNAMSGIKDYLDSHLAEELEAKSVYIIC